MAATLEISSERGALFRLIKNGKAIDVPYARAKQTLQEECLKGGLLWKGVRLIPDLIAPYSLKIVAKREGDFVHVSAHLARKERSIPLTDCQALFVGGELIAVSTPFLIAIDSDIDRRALARLFPTSLTLSESDWRSFKEQIEDDLPIDEQGKAKRLEILPCLRLYDRMGAFANLFLTYNETHAIAIDDPRSKIGPYARDQAQEKGWERDLLETGFIVKNCEGARYFCPMDRVFKSLSFLLELGWSIYDNQGKRVHRQKEVVVAAVLKKDRIELQGEALFDNYQAPLEDMVGSFNRRERFINLSEESVGLIDYDRFAPPPDLNEREGELSMPRWRIGEVKEWVSEKSGLQLHFEDLIALTFVAPSDRFKGQLYPYQQEGVNFLHYLYRNRFGGLLADEMGLGKSVQVLAFFSGVDISLPKLIVCPTSLLFNWRQEIERFLPGISLAVHHGPLRAKKSEELSGNSIVLTSYALLRQDDVLLSEIDWDVIVFDEAQAFKNPESQLFKALSRLSARSRIALSGTPIENRPDDIWSLYAILMPELLKDRKTFTAQMMAAEVDSRYRKSIQTRMSPFFLRRKKDEVLRDLPEKIEQIVWVEMGEEQRACYEELLVRSKGAESTMEILEAILRLRQVCADPRLAGFEAQSAKLQVMLEDLQSVVESGHKVLVISQFTQMLGLIKREITVPYVYLDGQTKDRESVVTTFQQDPQVPVMLMSLKAGGVGLNLTAADYVFLFDPWWNEAAERQAIDRAHRLGRAQSVIAKRYVTRLSIEEKIMTLKESKNKLCAQIMDLDSQAASLTHDDLMQLLN